MCWEGPFFPTHESWWGEAGGISKGHYSRSKSGGGRSQLVLHVLPRQSRRIRGEGKRHAQRKEPSFPSIRKGQGRDAIQPPISQTIAKVKDLVSESMRWVVGMWWGKQRCWERGARPHISPALQDAGGAARGLAGLSSHWSASPKTSFCLRFMFSKSKAEPAMRL